MAFTVACAQMAPEKARVEANLDRIVDLIVQASDAGADLVVFPEASTTGYFLEGGVVESAISDDQLLDKLSKRLMGRIERPTDAVVGFYQVKGGNLYNSAAYFELGTDQTRIVHVYQKFFLPTYGVFDEERFVSRGHDLGVFDTRLGRFGLLLCEDIWHSILPSLNAVAGASVLIVPSASPARGFSGPEIGNLDHYVQMTRAVSQEHGVYCVNCQLTGFEGGKGLVGGSSITDPAGKVVARGPVGEEHLLLAPIDLDLVVVARAALPLIADLQSAWQDIRRLVSELEP